MVLRLGTAYTSEAEFLEVMKEHTARGPPQYTMYWGCEGYQDSVVTNIEWCFLGVAVIKLLVFRSRRETVIAFCDHEPDTIRICFE